MTTADTNRAQPVTQPVTHPYVGPHDQARPPVGLEELRAAVAALRAGEFRPGGRRTPPAHEAPARPEVPGQHAPGMVIDSEPMLPDLGPLVENESGDRLGRDGTWSPQAGEVVIPILGATGAVGTSTLALALACVLSGPGRSRRRGGSSTGLREEVTEISARLLECSSASTSGLAAATTAELGVGAGWRLGRRDDLSILRTLSPLEGAAGVPIPPPVLGSSPSQRATVLDVGWEPHHVAAVRCWLRAVLRAAPVVVMVAHPTFPSFARAEGALAVLDAIRQDENHGPPLAQTIVLAVHGPRRRKWPRGLDRSGRRTSELVQTGHLVEVPHDADLAVAGPDSRPLPAALLTAAGRLADLVVQPLTRDEPAQEVAETGADVDVPAGLLFAADEPFNVSTSAATALS